MAITPSKLREDVYNVLDKVLETGVPIEITRRGKVLTIIPPPGQGKLAKLKKRAGLKCNPDDIVHMDWSIENQRGAV